MIGMRTPVGARPHRVWLQRPGPSVPDGDGGWTNSWIDLTPPRLSVKIIGATASTLEKIAAGTVIATATHEIAGPFHPGVTTKTRVLFDGRQFQVNFVNNIEERSEEMALVATEIVA